MWGQEIEGEGGLMRSITATKKILLNYRVVALYGIGKNTQMILEQVDTGNIIGILDGYVHEGKIGEKEIMSIQKAIQLNVEAIIIIARPSSTKVIYKRIKSLCKDEGIAVYDMDGNNLMELKEDILQSDYYEINEETLLKQIKCHEIISFDIFDTLISRKLIVAEDIFRMMARSLSKDEEDFCLARMHAEKYLSTKKVASIREIYEYLRDIKIIASEEIEKMISLEIALEKKILVARKKMVEVLEYAIKCGKSVYLTSDMYLSRNILSDLLSDLGIKGYKDIIVSCEYGVDKSEGLFNILKQVSNSDKILHIGNDLEADESAGQRYGIDTYRILSSEDMFEISAIRNMFTESKSLEDRLMIGAFIARAFNDPFMFYNTQGKVLIKHNEDLGYLFIAPIICQFVEWLMNELSKKKYEYLLFISRDGYLVKEIYDLFTKKNKRQQYPESIYFLTSRTLNVAATADNVESIKYGSNLPFYGSPEEMLAERFFVNLGDIDSFDHKQTIEQYVLSHKHQIFSCAKGTKVKYLRYIDDLNISNCKPLAIFDFVSTGTCQMCLEEILDTKLEGYYFCRLHEDYWKKQRLKINSMIDSNKSEAKNVLSYYLWLEVFIKDTMPSLLSFNSNGEPEYRTSSKSERLISAIKEVQKGILNYCNEYIDSINICNTLQQSDVSNCFFNILNDKYLEIECEAGKAHVVKDEFNNRKIDLSAFI